MAEDRTGERAGRGEGTTALRVAAVVLGLLVALLFLWKVRSIAIIAFLGVLFGIVLASATSALERIHLPRPVGAPLILLAILGSLVGVGIGLAPTLREQFEAVREELPSALDRVESSLGMPSGTIQAAVDDSGEQDGEGDSAAGGGGGIRGTVVRNLGEVRQILFPVAGAAANAITGFIIFLFVMLFYAIAPKFYFDGSLRLLPPDARPHAADVMHEVASSLRQWLVARLIAMVVIGLVTGISLGILGIRSAILLGVLAGLLELIPFFGPIIASIPAIGMGLLDSPQKALGVVILFVVIQQLEGNVLTPLLLKNRADVPPLLTILMVPALTLVFGLIGALVAEPLTAAALVLVRRLWIHDRLEEPDGAS